ncbi:Y-family DNA polymerase [Alphaproteobacteria bacterium]|nr:Y-family DNA polymerase [Alphaproteobacteria bacterium]
MSKFGLVDCNNFYASCERVFQPKLKNVPIIVLSNNDGCVVARSQEVKVIGIPMGIPLFKIKHLIKKYKIIVISSNYALYGDLSERIMNIITNAAPKIEIYSIDECFIDLDQISTLSNWSAGLQKRIYKWVGIPVSIGIGKTKTIAKIANKIAKSESNTGGILDLSNDIKLIEKALANTKIDDVWGIGSKWSVGLKKEGVKTALDLRNAPDAWVRQKLGIVGLRTAHELKGVVCHEIDTQPAAKKTTCCSRSFGTNLSNKRQIQDAVISFAERATEKIRYNKQLCSAIQVFISTNRFNKKITQYTNSAIYSFIEPTSDSIIVTSTAIKLLNRIWHEGNLYNKAGVILLDLSYKKNFIPSLFQNHYTSNEDLMNAIDNINKRFGRGSVGLGLSKRNAKWKMIQNNLSPSFTTKWKELVRAQAN